jgi:hypothetical protein
MIGILSLGDVGGLAPSDLPPIIELAKLMRTTDVGGPPGAATATVLPREQAHSTLHVLAYSLTGVMNIIGIQPLVAARRA